MELQRDISRSRPDSAASAGADGGAAQRHLGAVVRRPRLRLSSGSATSVASRRRAGAARRARRCGRSRTATPAPRRGGDRRSAAAGRPARTRARSRPRRPRGSRSSVATYAYTSSRLDRYSASNRAQPLGACPSRRVSGSRPRPHYGGRCDPSQPRYLAASLRRARSPKSTSRQSRSVNNGPNPVF